MVTGDTSARHADLSEDGEREESPPTMSQSDVHRLLVNERRRAVLRLLVEADEELSVRELSERIAAEETGTSPPPRDVRHSVYVSLQQNHVPKLDEAAVVDYDERAKTARPNDRTRQLYRYMEGGTDGGPWTAVFVVSSALGTGSVVLALLDVVPFSQIPPVSLAVALVVLHGVAALVWYRHMHGGDDDFPATGLGAEE